MTVLPSHAFQKFFSSMVVKKANFDIYTTILFFVVKMIHTEGVFIYHCFQTKRKIRISVAGQCKIIVNNQLRENNSGF